MEVRIVKSARACQVCHKAFVHEQTFTSAIHLAKDEFAREDYCKECWDPETSGKAYSVWTGQFYDPSVAEQGSPEVFSPLRQIFYEAVEYEGRDQLAVAYLAAQLLRRQRVFRMIKETQDPDTEVSLILFSDRIGNRLIEVHDPTLTHEELDEGRRFLMRRLNELENPEPEESVDDGQNEDEYAQV